jgi:hypothetical protein
MRWRACAGRRQLARLLAVGDPLSLPPGRRARSDGARARATSSPLRAATALLLAVTAAAVHAGCDAGDPARPGLPPPATVAGAPTIGPTPLRRLSDDEYLNALHDLFPALSPALPALPADVPVAGFDNAAEGQEPSDVLIARFEAIANLYAAAATIDTPSVSALVGCADFSTPALATTCSTQFVMQMGSRLFRRPLEDGERDRFLLRFQGWASATDFAGAVQLTLSAMLQSPQFLYRAEPVPQSQPAGTIVPAAPYAMASRLSFFLWESVPDDVLLQAASRGELVTDAQLRAQAARMLADPRALRVLWSFPRQWLGLDRILLDEHAARSPEVDPLWTTATQAAAYEETQLFVQNVLGEGGTFRELLTSRRAWVNGEMARVYGLAGPRVPSLWGEVVLPENERAGLLTRVSFLAGNSHRGATSPPVRGNAIQLSLLCELPTAPPPGVDTSQPTAPPGSGPQTNRMLFEQRTQPALCQGCHVGLNGFGFGFESYDAAGHFQSTDDTLPVDATGIITGTDVDGPFDGAIALSDALSRSEVVHECATQELVRYALGRAPVDVEAPMVAALAKRFMESGGDLRALLTDVALMPSFRMLLVEEN